MNTVALIYASNMNHFRACVVSSNCVDFGFLIYNACQKLHHKPQCHCVSRRFLLKCRFVPEQRAREAELVFVELLSELPFMDIISLCPPSSPMREKL